MKYILSILSLVLAGCQATIPESLGNSQPPTESVPTISPTQYTTSIVKPTYIEQDNNKPGEYPQQYPYIIANKIQAKPITLFKPIPYVTSKSIQGWGTCYINPSENFNEHFLVIIKNNEIIETFSSPETITTCEKLKSQQQPIEEAKEKALYDETIKKFTSIVDDPSQFHLFGEPPKNPELIMKKQLNFFLEDPDSAEIKNISVRKTFLVSQDNVIYCYLVFANIRTKNIRTGLFRPTQKAVFYMKNDKILEHKIFSENNSGSGLKMKKELVSSELENDDIEPTKSKKRIKQTISVQKSPQKNIKVESNKKNKIAKTPKSKK